MNCWLCGGPRPGCACSAEEIDDDLSGRPTDPWDGLRTMQNIARLAQDIDLAPLQIGFQQLHERVREYAETHGAQMDTRWRAARARDRERARMRDRTE